MTEASNKQHDPLWDIIVSRGTASGGSEEPLCSSRFLSQRSILNHRSALEYGAEL